MHVVADIAYNGSERHPATARNVHDRGPRKLLFDAYTAYNMYRYKAVADGESALQYMAREADPVFRNWAESVPFHPHVLPAYKDFREGRGRLVGTKSDFRESLCNVRTLPTWGPFSKRYRRIVFITTFNEWYEGTSVEPGVGRRPGSPRLPFRIPRSDSRSRPRTWVPLSAGPPFDSSHPHILAAVDGRRWELTILGSMFVGYMAYILSRTVLAVASPEMVADPSLGLDEAGYGDIAAWGMAGMVTGKLVTGVIADWLGGRRVFLIALSITAVLAASFSWGTSTTTFAVINFFLLFAMAASWPSIASLISVWFPPTKYGRGCGAPSPPAPASVLLYH